MQADEPLIEPSVLPDEIADQIERWSGERVVVRFDPTTGTWIFLALHDGTLGRPTGGTRMRIYPELTDALTDAMRLAEGMTHKWAALGMDYGGGKAVLAIPRPLGTAAREALFLRYGTFLESLDGAFATGADLGTGPAAMAIVAQATRYVLGYDREARRSEDPGPFTAHGVERGLRAGLERVFGSSEVADRTVLVEGLGDVGEPLARELAAEGATLLLSDIIAEKAEKLAEELGGRAVASSAVATTACDVYAPCAIGGILSRDTIPGLSCRLIAGSANNQLLEPEDAERLHARGILYVPDYILNAGGAMAFALMIDGLTDRDALMRRVASIGDTVTELLAEAAADDSSPVVAARRRVERLLASRRGGPVLPLSGK